MSDATPLSLVLLPAMVLRVDAAAAAAAPEALRRAFAQGTGEGLLQLAGVYPTQAFNAPEAYWRDLAKLYLTRFIAQGTAVLDPLEDERWVAIAPPMPGGEYLASHGVKALWEQLATAVGRWQEAQGKSIQDLLVGLNPAWETLGRVCFSLAEHGDDPSKPFAFVATYTTRFTLAAKPQHALLGRVLKDLLASGQHSGVARIGAALQAAATRSPLVAAMLADKRLYTPQAFTSGEAYQLLCHAAELEAAGLTLRVPAWWNAAHPPRLRVAAELGAAAPSKVGVGALLDFRLGWSLQGQPLSDAEWASLRDGADGLVLIRGQWVEVDRQRLDRVLKSWRQIEALVEHEGLSFAHALRLIHRLQSPPQAAAGATAGDRDWAEVRAGPWLRDVLSQLRHPEAMQELELGPGELRAALRPYQKTGLQWLWTLHQLGLGGCLADDMGLGKTIQVLALLALLKKKASANPKRQRELHLIIAPATLIGNWQAEAAKFTPQLRVFVAHPAFASKGVLAQPEPALEQSDLVITTYGSLLRYAWLQQTQWSLAVLDEAQQIKNPQAQQTQAVKGLKTTHRLALTGTPVENKPLDLWSLFDFINPGLLGTQQAYTAHLTAEAGASVDYAHVRALIQPYLLRRLKTDTKIIADLPPKTELAVRCGLMPAQAALYARLVDELKVALKPPSEGEDSKSAAIQRKGAVLSTLLKLKQVCAHPAMITGEGAYPAAGSGKLQRLLEIAGEIAARQEKVLVFTQFRIMTQVLAQLLTRVFGRPGCVLHGETPLPERRRLVEAFQQPAGPPFFVLSVKAGGTGLTLTEAAHVIHFDRWWNPAVEDQATDRAYRIGQKRPVLVHKFTCAGTVEARIAELLSSKRGLAAELLGGHEEIRLTELSDDDLLQLVALDLSQAGLGTDD